MSDYKRYISLHDEIMHRLEDGQITTEQAKDVIDMAFEKYVMEPNNMIALESFRDIINKISNSIFNFKIRNETYEYLDFDRKKLDDDSNKTIDKYTKIFKSYDDKIRKAIDDAWEEFNEKYNPIDINKSIISIKPKHNLSAEKIYNKNKLKKVEIYLYRKYIESKSFKSAENVERFANILMNKLDDMYKNDDSDSMPGIGYDIEKPYKLYIDVGTVIKTYTAKEAEKVLQIK